MTSIEDAVKLVLHTAKLSGSRVVAEFNGFILDSKNSYDKNLDLYWAYMGRADRNVNWEQRRYEIAKTMLPAIYTDDGNAARADHSPINGFEYKTLEGCCREAIRFADTAIFEYADFENGCVTIQEKTLGMNTGLRDKNNHEIYGGDILAHNGRVIGHVIDGVRGYCFDVVYADPVSTSTWSLYGIVVNDYEGDVEVVGNIYDNPEMVKKGGTV